VFNYKYQLYKKVELLKLKENLKKHISLDREFQKVVKTGDLIKDLKVSMVIEENI